MGRKPEARSEAFAERMRSMWGRGVYGVVGEGGGGVREKHDGGGLKGSRWAGAFPA